MLKIRNETDFALDIFVLGASESSEVLKTTLSLYQVVHIEAGEVWIGFDANNHKYRNHLGYNDTSASITEIFITGIHIQSICAKKKIINQDLTITTECLRFYRIS
jgi:hypothetical protein